MQISMGETWDPLLLIRDGARSEVSRFVRGVILLNFSGTRLVGHTSDGVRRSASIDPLATMVLDRSQPPERVLDYVRDRLEPRDIIDVAVDASDRIVGVWIHVYYRNKHLRSEYRRLMPSMKSDALFAARTNPGRRSEHWTAVNVLSPLGHEVTALHRTNAEGHFPFIIDYAVMDKRSASEDLRCQLCSHAFEVKARIRDFNRRPSHSRSRPFWFENEPEDFHVFHYRRDNSFEVLRNNEIETAARSMTDSGKIGEMDRYLDLGKKGGQFPRALRPDEYRCRIEK